MSSITNPDQIAELWVKRYPFTDRSGQVHINTYRSDWAEAAEYASWDPSDVVEVLATAEGENDGDNWLMVVRLKDGRYSFLSAGCDYTGWDCRAGGCSLEYNTLEDLIRFGLGIEDRERLGMPLSTPSQGEEGEKP